jgi:hypothetical protein
VSCPENVGGGTHHERGLVDAAVPIGANHRRPLAGEVIEGDEEGPSVRRDVAQLGDDGDLLDRDVNREDESDRRRPGDLEIGRQRLARVAEREDVVAVLVLRVRDRTGAGVVRQRP